MHRPLHGIWWHRLQGPLRCSLLLTSVLIWALEFPRKLILCPFPLISKGTAARPDTHSPNPVIINIMTLPALSPISSSRFPSANILPTVSWLSVASTHLGSHLLPTELQQPSVNRLISLPGKEDFENPKRFVLARIWSPYNNIIIWNLWFEGRKD